MNIFNANKRLPALFILMLLLPLGAFAFDWGLFTEHNFDIENTDNPDPALSYSGRLVPWFSTPLLDGNADLYLSAGFALDYKNKETTPFAEVLQADFAYRFTAGALGQAEIKAGRTRYADPLGLIASGLFDGLHVAADTPAGVFNAGLFYTGLLYKNSADISVNRADMDANAKTVAVENLGETYFASRRALAVLGWEHPALMNILRLKVSLVSQSDMNGRDSYHHSQYLAARAALPVKQLFVFSLGGAAALAETETNVKLGMLGEVSAAVYLPTPIMDRLSFRGIFSSGESDSIAAFVPLTTVSQGNVLGAKISGVSMLALDYTVRLHRTFSAVLSNSYFVLSDLGTYQSWPAKRGGYFLGNEFYARLIWAPVSDMRLNFGGGMFLPALGNADPTAAPKWKMEAAVQLAIF